MSGKRSSLTEKDVVKKAYLYMKRPGQDTIVRITRFKAWQKKFLVLRDMNLESGVSTLEVYQEESEYLSTLPDGHRDQEETPLPAPRKKAQMVVDLKLITGIESYVNSRSHPHAIMLLCQLPAPIIIGCNCDVEKNSWMQTLKQLVAKRQFTYRYQNTNVANREEFQSSKRSVQRTRHISSEMIGSSVQGLSTSDSELSPNMHESRGSTEGRDFRHNMSFNESCDLDDFVGAKCEGVSVTVEATADSTRLGISGEYYMNVYDAWVTLTNIASLQEMVRWPIYAIRKFQNELNRKTAPKYLITLEANGECGDSAGRFCFRTKHGPDLITRVRRCTCRASPRINNTHGASQVSHRRAEATRTTLLRKLSTGINKKADVTSLGSRSMSGESAPWSSRSLDFPTKPLYTRNASDQIVYADLQSFDSDTASSSYGSLPTSDDLEQQVELNSYLDIVGEEGHFGQQEDVVEAEVAPEYLCVLPPTGDQTPSPTSKDGDYLKVWQMDSNVKPVDPDLPPPIPPRPRSNTWGTGSKESRTFVKS